MTTIREARNEDRLAIRSCLIELQEYERRFESLYRSGEEMIDNYINYLDRQFEKNSGKFFVAEKDGAIVGVIAVWLHEQLDEYLCHPIKVAYISDLVVKSSFRGEGIGSLLLAEAENYARSSGMKLIKIGSLARNTLSHAMYRKSNYRDYTLQLIKEL